MDAAAPLLQADRELMLRRSLPSCSPRAVAAARILSAQSPAELEGRSAESLGQWKQPVSPINEVILRSWSYVFHGHHCHSYHKAATWHAGYNGQVRQFPVVVLPLYHADFVWQLELSHPCATVKEWKTFFMVTSTLLLQASSVLTRSSWESTYHPIRPEDMQWLQELYGKQSCKVCALQVKALRMLAGVAFFVLSRFPATLEQDKQLLAGQSAGPLPDDMALAVQFRLGKKQLMAELLHDLANRIKVTSISCPGLLVSTYLSLFGQSPPAKMSDLLVSAQGTARAVMHQR